MAPSDPPKPESDEKKPAKKVASDLEGDDPTIEVAAMEAIAAAADAAAELGIEVDVESTRKPPVKPES